MSLKAWRIIRTILHYAFYACCVLVVLFPILVFGSLLMNPFTGFAGSSAFADKPGAAAKRLLNEWPTGVVPSSVKLVSRKYDYSIDSHSSWYKIELDSNSAQIWADAVHVDRERDSLQCLRQDDRGLEAVRRIVPGPPRLHWATGDSPPWWTPPNIAFRATEAMKWYSGFDSGVGQAAYTGYDVDRGTLWIYEYSCQHDRLWEPNQIPTGEVFSRLKDAEPSDAHKSPVGREF